MYYSLVQSTEFLCWFMQVVMARGCFDDTTVILDGPCSLVFASKWSPTLQPHSLEFHGWVSRVLC